MKSTLHLLIILLLTCMGFLDFISAMQKLHAATLRLPRTFPTNFPTFIYIEKKNGAVYFGYMNKYGRKVPEWTTNQEFEADDAVEDVFVKMPNGISFIAVVRPLQTNVSPDNELREDHRCFILYDGTNILVTDLKPVNEIREPFTSPIIIQVRMPGEHNHKYLGGFEHYNGPRPKWLRIP